ncbi:MAG: ester cyclase, partial [Candidatus Dormibacteraceae bacterium]
MTDAALQTKFRQVREATVREHIDAENRHNPDATLATFSDARASYDIPAFGDAGRMPDHDAVRQLYVSLFSAFPDFHVDAGRLRHGDDHIFVEARFTGTQHADFAGIPSAGRSFNTRVACLYEFEEDQL